MERQLTLELERPRQEPRDGSPPAPGSGPLRRRLDRLMEVAREEHVRLRDVDAERELRARENYGGE